MTIQGEGPARNAVLPPLAGSYSTAAPMRDGRKRPLIGLVCHKADKYANAKGYINTK